MERNESQAERKPIIALGELLVDFIPENPEEGIADTGSVLKTASGSAGIFACAAARLGAPSAFIGKVGKDSLSRMVTNAISSQGVDISRLTVSDEGQIGLAFLEYTKTGRNYQYYRENSVGSRLSADNVDDSAVQGAYAVHFPGMLLELTAEMRSACEKLVELAKKYGVAISFDPNIRRELAKDPVAHQRLIWAVRQADIVAPTLEEAKIITGKETIGDILRALHELGPRVVALTRDKNGAVFSMDGRVAVADGIPIEEIDPTGAGDALAAALCVALKEKMPLEKLAAFCNCAGALVITRRGAIGMALPSRDQVEAMMASGICHVHCNTLENME